MEEMRQFYEIYNISTEEYENINIDNAEFSVRVSNRLHRAGINTIGALLKCTHNRLAELNGFGAGCFKEIYDYLKKIQSAAVHVEQNIKSVKKRSCQKVFLRMQI